MTKREAAVLQAYTGIKMLEGFDQEYAEQYINELLGEPCTSPHQLLTPGLMSRKSTN